MHAQPITRARHGFTLIEILIVVVILGILAAIVIPQFTDASMEASRSNLQSQLQTCRSQIELYNVQHPATPYDAVGFGETDPGSSVQQTALSSFWDAMVEGDYLQMLPKNPLQNNSTLVGAGPGPGTGWIWNVSPGGGVWTLNIYAVDEQDLWFDGDGDGTPD